MKSKVLKTSKLEVVDFSKVNPWKTETVFRLQRSTVGLSEWEIAVYLNDGNYYLSLLHENKRSCKVMKNTVYAITKEQAQAFYLEVKHECFEEYPERLK